MHTCFGLCFQTNFFELLSCFHACFETPSEKIFMFSKCISNIFALHMFWIKFLKYGSKPSFYVSKPHFQKVLFRNILVYVLKLLWDLCSMFRNLWLYQQIILKTEMFFALYFCIYLNASQLIFKCILHALWDSNSNLNVSAFKIFKVGTSFCLPLVAVSKCKYS